MAGKKRGAEDWPGERLVEVWVPDTGDPAVAEELRRQLEVVRKGEDEEDVMTFLEEVRDWEDVD